MNALKGACIAALLMTVSSMASAITPTPTPTPTPPAECAAVENTLFAGQTIDVGSVEIRNNVTSLFIKYTTEGDWFIKEIHAYASTDPLPVNGGGNPAPGQFPYKFNFSTPLPQMYEIEIPLASLGVDCDSMVNVATHAVVCKIVDGAVVKSETAWGFGEKRWTGSRWGWYTCYTICCEFECEEITEDFQSLEQTEFFNGMLGELNFEGDQFSIHDNGANPIWESCEENDKILWMPNQDPFGTTAESVIRQIEFKQECVLLSFTAVMRSTAGRVKIFTLDSAHQNLESAEFDVTTECTEIETGFTIPATFIKVFTASGSELGISSLTYCCPSHE